MLLQTHESVLHHILCFVRPQPDADQVAQQRLAKFAVQNGSLARHVLVDRRASGIASGNVSPLIASFSCPRSRSRRYNNRVQRFSGSPPLKIKMWTFHAKGAAFVTINPYDLAKFS